MFRAEPPRPSCSFFALWTTSVRSIPLHYSLLDLSLGDVVTTMNELSGKGRVEFYEGAGGEVSYRLVAADVAAQRSGLAVEEVMVLQEVERSGNVGVWVRNVKLRTKLQQTQLNKILKRLEARKLIKSVRSVAYKNRRMYMSYGTTPAKELTGGPWYTNEVLDTTYVAGMRDASVKLLRELGKPATAKELARLIADRKVSNAKISVADVRQLVETLVLDGILDYANAGERRMRMLPRAARHLFPYGLVFDPVEEEDMGGGGGRGEGERSDDEGSEAGGPARALGGPASGPVMPASGFVLIPAGPGLASGKFSISAGGGSSATVGLGAGVAARLSATARVSFLREPMGSGAGRDDASEIAGGAGGEDSGREEEDEEEEESDEGEEEESEEEGGLRRTGEGKAAAGPRRYMLASKMQPDGGLLEALSYSPCGVCPVAKQCTPNGVISPRTCTYLTHWLADTAW